MPQARLVAGLGISRVLGSADSYATHRESGAVVDQLARRNRVAGSGEIAGRSRIEAEVTRRTRPDVRTSATRAASSLTTDRMVKAEGLDCCHTHPSRLLLAMEQQENNLNTEQLRKCARYFRALAAVPETTTTVRAELVRAADQFEALARQRTIDCLVLRVILGRRGALTRPQGSGG
jgi:hypothetical protein